MTSVADWLDGQADRVLGRQRARADTAKLLATFAAGIAAALAGTVLQVHTGAPARFWDRVDLYTLAACLVLTVIVVLLDRLREADHEAVLAQCAAMGLDQSQQLAMLRVNTLAAVIRNDEIIKTIRFSLLAQLATAVLSSGIAITSLLRH